jgi:uncharacterized protein (DUF2147 family)
MAYQFLCGFLALILYTGTPNLPIAAANRVCGKWQTEEKNLIIQIYSENNQFKAKILWFNDKDDTKDLNYWTDEHNPDLALRNRKILGMNVLENLVYDSDSNSWEDGIIYDAKSGRHWNSSAYINDDGQLKVKGYWRFKFIGKTLTFKRMDN